MKRDEANGALLQLLAKVYAGNSGVISAFSALLNANGIRCQFSSY